MCQSPLKKTASANNLGFLTYYLCEAYNTKRTDHNRCNKYNYCYGYSFTGYGFLAWLIGKVEVTVGLAVKEVVEDGLAGEEVRRKALL